MNEKFRAHCTRTVPFDICERTNPADQLWWKHVCEKLEADYLLVSRKLVASYLNEKGCRLFI